MTELGEGAASSIYEDQLAVSTTGFAAEGKNNASDHEPEI